MRSSIDWTLGDNFERLILTGTGDTAGTGNNLNNIITGNGGANILSGEGGNDVIRGGDGSDWLDGGAGRDTLTGGAGADTFAFSDGDFAGLTATTADRITDFNSSQGDRINLEQVDADVLADGDPNNNSCLLYTSDAADE